MLVAAVNVADAVYTLTHIVVAKPTDEMTLEERQGFFRLAGTDTTNGETASVDIQGESNAYLALSVLLNSEEFFEHDEDLLHEGKIGEMYELLHNSDMKRFMP